MKANYTRDKETGSIIKKKMVLTKEEIAQYINEEWESIKDTVYAEVKNDVANQVLAVFFTVLNKEFGFGKKRLLKVKEGVEANFAIMQQGVFGNKFTPVDCINYLKKEFDIDLDKEGLAK